MAEKTLKTPLDEESVRDLNVGDTVYIDGTILTARDKAHMRALEYHEKGEKLPEGWKNAAIFHCGPLMRRIDKQWEVIAAGPTTSSRMNAIEPDVIRKFSVRAVIGKGGMSAPTKEAMEETGCVYLAQVGGAAVTAAESIKKIRDVHWYDLGMPEAMWVFEVEKFGPLTVAIDAHGRSIYEDIEDHAKKSLEEILSGL